MKFHTVGFRGRLLAYFFSVLFSSGLAATAFSQAEEQIWTSASVMKSTSDNPWRFGMEGTYRHSTTKEKTILQSIRTSFGYRLETGTVFSFMHQSRQAEADRDSETRLIVQAAHRFSFEDLDVGLRLSHEHRLFQDSKIWMHRTRGQVRLGLKALQMATLTPFIAQETLYVWNSVEARKAGSMELRLALGVAIPLLERLNLDVSYLDRRTYSDSNESRFHVALLAASYEI